MCVCVCVYIHTYSGKLLHLFYITENIARNKPTEQSSRVSNATDAKLAVDGNIASGCAITQTDITGSWWIVDLQQPYRVARIKLINCCGKPNSLYC